MNGISSPVIPISISPISLPPGFIVVFPVNGKQNTIHISVLENGDVDVDVDDHVINRAGGLIENVGIGVGVEFLRKELQ